MHGEYMSLAMPDAAIPIFQTVNLKGEATLEVEAIIKALGLTLKEIEHPAAEVLNSIFWKNPNTPKAYDAISGYQLGLGSHVLEMAAVADETNLSTGAAAIEIQGSNTGLSSVKIETAPLFKTLLDSAGHSNWLQIAGAGAENWHCNFGQVSVAWPGGVEEISVVVSHGLGVVPIIPLCFTNNIAIFIVTIGNFIGSTAIEYRVRCITGVVGAGLISSLYWFAIG